LKIRAVWDCVYEKVAKRRDDDGEKASCVWLRRWLLGPCCRGRKACKVDGCVVGTQEDAGRTEARTKRESNKNSKTQPLGQMRPTGRLSDVIPIGGLPLVFLTPIEFIRHYGNSSVRRRRSAEQSIPKLCESPTPMLQPIILKDLRSVRRISEPVSPSVLSKEARPALSRTTCERGCGGS
jgi:hypothetical protein